MTKVVKRSNLYFQVWQQSMVQLAKEYAVSDVGLAKICSKHNIPRPPRGYWARKQAGQSPRQTPLPDAGNDYDIPMRDPSQFGNSRSVLSNEVREEISKARSEETPIEIATTLRGAHELVSQAKEQFHGAEKDDYGLLIPSESAALNIKVSKAMLRRALILMDALLKAFEKRGYSVRRGPSVTLMDVSVSFGISEMLETTREEPEEYELDGEYLFGHSRYRETRKPSGQLALKIDGPGCYWSEGCRKMWRDSKTPLENRLQSFIEGVVKFAVRIKEHRVQQELEEQKREESKRRREQEAQHRAEKRALIKAERMRVRELYRDAKNWKRSQSLREYINAKRQLHEAGQSDAASNDEFAKWATWAGQQADRLDPFRANPPSIVDEDTPELEEPAAWRTRSW